MSQSFTPLAPQLNRTDVAPGERFTVTTTINDSGIFASFGGTLAATNTSSSTLVVGAYEARLEYFSSADNRWITFAHIAFGPDGSYISSNPGAFSSVVPLQTGGTPGVTFSDFGTPPQTTLEAGATARWTYVFGSSIPAADAAQVIAAARTGGVRLNHRLDSGPEGPTVDGVLDLTPPFAALKTLADLTVTASLDGAEPTILAITSPIGPGQFTATYAGELVSPTLPGRASFASDELYVQELRRAAVQPLPLTLRATTPAGVGTRSASVPRSIPAVAFGLVSPPSIVAGQPTHYDLLVRNDGSGTARELAVGHLLNGSPLGSSTVAPELAPAQTGTGSVDFTAPSSGPLADTTTLVWSDRNGNSYGPVAQTSRYCGGGACPAPTMSETTSIGVAQPELVTTLGWTPATVVPGDNVTYTGDVTYAGLSLGVNGQISIENAGFSPLTIAGYRRTFEYHSIGDGEWIPFARLAVGEDGQVQPETSLLQLSWSSFTRYTETSAGGPLLGESLAPTEKGMWSYTQDPLSLPRSLATLLLDQDAVDGIRSVLEVYVAGGDTASPVAADLAPAVALFRSGLDQIEMNVTLFYGNIFAHLPLASATGGTLSLGMTLMFAGTFPAPAFPARAPELDEASYLATLTAFNEFGYQIRGSASVRSPIWIQSESIGDLFRVQVPIIVPKKAGVAQSHAGLPQEYTVTLSNAGSSVAGPISIVDTVDDQPIEGASVSTPAAVVPGATGVATVNAPTPFDRLPGPMTDVVAVTWQDRNGNAYGPTHSSFTVDLAAGRPEGYVLLAGPTGRPETLGGPMTLTATVLDPLGQPLPGKLVRFTVTGANPQTADRTTAADGKATFQYAGSVLGRDTIIASATPVTAPVQSAAGHLDWTVPTGTPCTGPVTPLDVVLVVDGSPSLLNSKIEAARATSKAFIDQLDPSRDRIAISVFSYDAPLHVPLTGDFGAAKQGLDNAINELISDCSGFCLGGSNITAALTTALDELEGPRNRVGARPLIVFLTDGGNNGPDPTPALARAATSPARRVAIGLTSDIDAVMLSRLASSPNDYFYAPSSADLAWVYGNIVENACRNQPPLVRAGGDQGAYGVRLPDMLTLQGEAHGTGSRGDLGLTTEWTLVSGPAAVTFGDASSPVTTALFTTPGSYVLQLAANDGFLTTADRATITVDSEPSLAGAILTAALGLPGPLNTGTAETVTATLLDTQGHPIPRFPIAFTITGANAMTGDGITNANGIATFTYVGARAGTDILQAVALGGTTQLQSPPLMVLWQAAAGPGGPIATQGWIASPVHQSKAMEPVPIILGDVTLTAGTVRYYPATAPDRIQTLATGLSGAPGATLATLDTTLLANGAYIVELEGTNDAGVTQTSGAQVTVEGDYKPGRLVTEIQEFSIPLPGIPLTVSRRYDSLDKDRVGDFGYGWSLAIGNPRLETDAAHNVTVTMPGGRRVTFYFAGTAFPFPFRHLLVPTFLPEAGVFGSLTSDGCGLMVRGGDSFVCFLDGNLDFAPTTYTYTDPYGVAFTMAASGELKSIRDRQGSTLTFSATGIASNNGELTITFERDDAGRITKITRPPRSLAPFLPGDEYVYVYDAAGDLTEAKLPPLQGNPRSHKYTYATHRLLTSIDPRGHAARTSTYDPDGRLLTDTDALGQRTSYAYDLPARTTTITNPDDGVVTLVHDPRGLLLSETDPLGHTNTHIYDAARNEIERINATNEHSRFTYDGQGNQLTSTNVALSETTTTTYNAFGQPTSFTDALGRTTTLTYDVQTGLLTRMSDTIGVIADATWSVRGLPLTITDASGKTAYLAYDESGHLTSTTDRLGRVTRKSYDGAGNLTVERNPRGGATVRDYDNTGVVGRVTREGIIGGEGFEYDRTGNVTRARNPFGDRLFSYDDANRATRTTVEDGTFVDRTYDFRGNVLTEKDELNRITAYEYDLAGHLTKTTFPDLTFRTQGYDELGRLVSTTNERGKVTHYEYQAGCGCSERLTKVTDPLGRATTTAYDATGRRTSVTDAAGHSTHYEYDARGHLTKTTFHNGTTVVDTYDGRNRRTSSTDQNGKTTLYGHDDAGQLTSVTDPLGNITTYAYDANGNLTSAIDANQHVTRYEFDLYSRKTKRTLPLGMSETFTYDARDVALTHTDFRGKTTTYGYVFRLLASKTPDPTLGESPVTFSYHPDRTRQTMTDASGVTRYTYDSRRRLRTKETPAGTLSYTYDPVGNVASIRSSNANGSSVDYAWDGANQLVYVVDNRVGGTTTSAYTATGRPLTVAQPNGVEATYAFDNGDRVTYLSWKRGTSPAFRTWAYTYGLRGQHLTSTDITGRTATYGYDAASRLTRETITGGSSEENGVIDYILDAVANRLSQTSSVTAVPTTSHSFNSNDQLTSNTYDLNGNTTVADANTFSYDSENRLILKGNGAVAVVYDGDGNRVAKTVGGVTTHYLIDDLNPTGYLQVMEELSTSGVQVRYVYANTLVSQTRNVNALSATNYYGYDARGNITFLTDDTGAVTDSYDYEAWGHLISSEGSTPNTRFYLAEELDPDLGLINLRARQYNPSTGRFLTVDIARGRPLEPTSQNRYLYAEGDPVGRIDPLGLEAGVSTGILLGAVAGAILVEETVRISNVANTRSASIEAASVFASGIATACSLAKAIVGTGITGSGMYELGMYELCTTTECPPCPEPPPRSQRTDTTHGHWPCPGAHTHYYRYEYNQNSKTCVCYLKEIEERVECH